MLNPTIAVKRRKCLKPRHPPSSMGEPSIAPQWTGCIVVGRGRPACRGAGFISQIVLTHALLEGHCGWMVLAGDLYASLFLVIDLGLPTLLARDGASPFDGILCGMAYVPVASTRRVAPLLPAIGSPRIC